MSKENNYKYNFLNVNLGSVGRAGNLDPKLFNRNMPNYFSEYGPTENHTFYMDMDRFKIMFFVLNTDLNMDAHV